MGFRSFVRRVASSLLGRQAFVSSVFAIFVLVTLVFQALVPLAVIDTSRAELGGLDRIASAYRLLAATARREISASPSGASEANLAALLAPYATDAADYSLARERVARRWREARSDEPKIDALANLATATTLLVVKLSDASQLTYDGDVDGINFGDLLSTQLPRAIDREVYAAAIAERFGAKASLADRLTIARYAAQAEALWVSGDNDFELGIEATAIPTERLRAAHDAVSRAFRELDAAVGTASARGGVRSREAFARQSEAFVTATSSYASALDRALREIIAHRIERERAAFAKIFALCIMTLGLGILAELSRRRSARQRRSLKLEIERAGALELALARQRVDRARVLNEAQFRTIFDVSPLGIATVDRTGSLVERNPALDAMLDPGFDLFDESFERGTFERVLASEIPPHQIERRVDTVRGTRWIDLTVFPIENFEGDSVVAIAMMSDVTDRKASAEQLRHEATHDALTGLMSRGAFLARVRTKRGRVEDSALRPALIMIDLDRFKFVNDTFGHAVGDEILTTVAARLRDVSRAGDVLARLHGDEFAILIAAHDRSEVARFVERVQHALRAPVAIGGREIAIDSSIGVCLLTGAEAPEDALHDADTAMYRAKQSGRGRHVFFDDTMREQSVRYGRLASDLAGNLASGAFRVVYQPIVKLADGEIDGFEALLRLRHPDLGEISPVEFIPIAEEMGTIHALGAFIIDEACRAAARWNARYPEVAPITMSVNLSGRQLVAGLPAQVEAAIRDSGIPGSSLMLEITESTLVESGPEVSRIFARLRAMGVRLCLDDFGTGYSSLRYLQLFPIDELKIDRSFVAGRDGDLASEPIARMLLGLAASLGIGVVAEGIETVVQSERLMALGCRLGQGFMYAKPGAAEEFDGPNGLVLTPETRELKGVTAS